MDCSRSLRKEQRADIAASEHSVRASYPRFHGGAARGRANTCTVDQPSVIRLVARLCDEAGDLGLRPLTETCMVCSYRAASWNTSLPACCPASLLEGVLAQVRVSETSGRDAPAIRRCDHRVVI